MRQSPRTCTVLLLTVMAACGGHATGPEPTLLPTVAPFTPDTTPAPVTASVSTTATSAPSTTALVTSVPAPTGSAAVTVVTAELLPPTVGTKVDSAPGVTTPGDIRELMPKLWAFVPSTPDPNDTNVQPPLPGDIDIIAGYLEARVAFDELLFRNPIATEGSPRLAAAYVDGGVAAAKFLQQLAAAGNYYDLGDGVVYRPRVVADPRSATEAYIFDCELDGSVGHHGDGSLIDGEVVGVKKYPSVSRMNKVDGRWLLDGSQRDDRACS